MTLSQVFEGLTEDKFCTGYYAYDANGDQRSCRSDAAVMWCVKGWMLREGLHAGSRLWLKAEAVAHRAGFPSIVNANDSMGYDFVKLLRQEGDR